MIKKEKILYRFLTVLITYLLIELVCFIFIKTNYIPAKLPTFRFASANDLSLRLIPNKDWGVWHKPGHLYYQDGCLEIDNFYNSYGTRDKEREKKSPDSNRVIFLGDSFVEGFGIKEGERFTSAMEKTTGHEMMNFGCNSFGALQSVMMYKKMATGYDHNTIIWGLFPFNDFPDDDVEITGQSGQYKPYAIKKDSGYVIEFKGEYNAGDTAGKKESGSFKEKTVRFLKAYTCWYNIITYLRNRKAEDKKFKAGSVIPSNYYDFSEEQLQRFRFILLELRKAAPVKRIILFTIPVVQDFMRMKKENKPALLPPRLKTICDEMGAEYLDLAPGILNAADNYRDFYFYCDPHWNVKGHQLVAELLTKQYKKTGE